MLQNCDSYEARLKSLGRSLSGEDEVSNMVDNLDSVSEQARRLKTQQVMKIKNCLSTITVGKNHSKRIIT